MNVDTFFIFLAATWVGLGAGIGLGIGYRLTESFIKHYEKEKELDLSK